MAISRIEVDFAVPVEVTDEEYMQLSHLVQQIAKHNTPGGCVHWAAGFGSKPKFSQSDSIFLGKPVDKDAPQNGEPTFDDSVFYIETCCRERYDGETT